MTKNETPPINKKSSKRLFKWIFYSLLGLFTLVVISVVSLPMVLNRPLVQEKIRGFVNSQLNGEIQWKKAEFSWKEAQVFQKIVLKDDRDEVVFSADELSLNTPLWQLFFSRNDLDFKLVEGAAELSFNREGVSNLQGIFGESSPSVAEKTLVAIGGSFDRKKFDELIE